jgi:hypothetical protein
LGDLAAIGCTFWKAICFQSFPAFNIGAVFGGDSASLPTSLVSFASFAVN